MSLILLIMSQALADRVYWTAPPAPTDSDALARTLPSASVHTLDELVDGGQAGDSARAIQALRQEFAAVRPLLSEFDGELQIMARLRKATADVTELHSPEESDLLWQALLFEGNAVHRYFGDRLATDPAAAPYRTVLGPAVVVAAWVDAVALRGPAAPPETELPEKPQRLAYDGVRALMQAMPAASFEIGRLASGAQVMLDGRVVDASPGSRTLLVPGRHFFTVKVADLVLLHGDAMLPDGATMTADAPFGPAERDDLLKLVQKGGTWEVPAAALVPIKGAGEPVFLAVPGKGAPRIVRVDRGTAEAVKLRDTMAPVRAWSVHAALGAGWVSTGDFFLLHVNDGAPYDNTAVNAFSPAASADVQWRSGLFAASAGVSGIVATGDFHSLPSGSTELRTFTYPHLGVGLPWLQATVGPMFPWYVGLGGEARVPVAGRLEVAANGVVGLPLTQERGSAPAFEPLPLFSLWGGIGWKFD